MSHTTRRIQEALAALALVLAEGRRTKPPVQLKSSRHGPSWVRPSASFDGPEGEELRDRSADLSISKYALQRAVRKARLAALTNRQWEKLDNTDSWGITPRRRKRLAKEYGRDTDRLDQAFDAKSKLPAPIIVHRKGHPPYLVGGNTRLMTAFVRGVRPKVLHARLELKVKKPKKSK